MRQGQEEVRLESSSSSPTSINPEGTGLKESISPSELGASQGITHVVTETRAQKHGLTGFNALQSQFQNA